MEIKDNTFIVGGIPLGGIDYVLSEGCFQLDVYPMKYAPYVSAKELREIADELDDCNNV